MKAFGKSTLRLFRKHILRLITIVAIVTVSIGFMSGIGEVETHIKTAAEIYYKQSNISDIYIKSRRVSVLPDGTVTNGFTADEIFKITKEFGEANVMKSYCYELKQDGDITRVYAFDLKNMPVNKLELISGALPSRSPEITVERKTSKLKSHDIGDTVTIGGADYTVCGTVLNPLIINKVEEPSFAYEGENLDYVVYFNEPELKAVNDIYVTLSNRELFKSFSKRYEKTVKGIIGTLTAELGAENVSVMSLYENVGYYSLISYAEKVGLIGIIFVVFFLLVTMLVVYSNMSRLFEEERSQIACLKTLGYNNFAVISRYTLFVLIGTLLGGLIALPIGLILTRVIYAAFNMQYAMPPFPHGGNFVFYLSTYAIITVTMMLLTFFTGLKTVQSKPVTLLSRKAPKSGKKVFLEHIKFIWNKLAFKYKSAVRNVLLFKSRFFMTVISIIGSTVLVLAGLGLMDNAAKMDNATSVLAISVALIVFSALLCALVIYNITNINVSERNREIATLMVLGYHDHEVCWYVYREIYIMCAIGAVLGVPLGLGFMTFVFNFVNFGNVADVNWWTWILAPAVTMLFAFLSTLLLRRKIVNTDMNASLKILE